MTLPVAPIGEVVIGPTIDRIRAQADPREPRRETWPRTGTQRGLIELTQRNREEAGCVTFIAYTADRFPHRFYLYDIFHDADAFEVHLA